MSTKMTVDELLLAQEKSSAFSVTIEAVEGHTDKVRVTPVEGEGCACGNSITLPAAVVRRTPLPIRSRGSRRNGRDAGSKCGRERTG